MTQQCLILERASNIQRATYSPEDNKLRIYLENFDIRLDPEVYAPMKSARFISAPMQELFVAHWSLEAEDCCMELAGSIEADDRTLVDRAIVKAERLEERAEKRVNEAVGYAAAAGALASRLSSGQPILAGHSSEQKARKQEKQLERSRDLADWALGAANYWLSKATGCERFANRKNNPSVVVNRIITLLADLRSLQREINHGYEVVHYWEKVAKIQDPKVQCEFARKAIGKSLKSGPVTPDGLDDDFADGNITVKQAIELSIDWGESITGCKRTARKIAHLLNRLTYERFMLGEVQPFQGRLTASILQAFAREQGAQQPEATRIDGAWELTSRVPLPLHVSPDGTRFLVMEDEAWIEAMVSAGYTVPVAKPKAPPIINFEADSVEVRLHGQIQMLRQISITKEEYGEVYKDQRGVKVSSCGQFRHKICKDPAFDGPYWGAEWVSVFLTDSKKHKVPESNSFIAKKRSEAA